MTKRPMMSVMTDFARRINLSGGLDEICFRLDAAVRGRLSPRGISSFVNGSDAAQDRGRY